MTVGLKNQQSSKICSRTKDVADFSLSGLYPEWGLVILKREKKPFDRHLGMAVPANIRLE